jgi:hypothetical protein
VVQPKVSNSSLCKEAMNPKLGQISARHVLRYSYASFKLMCLNWIRYPITILADLDLPALQCTKILDLGF